MKQLAQSRQRREETEAALAELSASSGMFSGLRDYLHDLFHLRSLQDNLDREEAWEERAGVEAGTTPAPLPLDASRIKEIIAEEELNSDTRPIYLSGLIPQSGIDIATGGKKKVAQGLIDAERHFFRSLEEYEAAFKKDSFPLADILLRFARLFAGRGHHQRAHSYLQKAWAIIQNAGKQSAPETGLILVMLIEVAHRCKNHFESDQGFYNLLELTEQPGGERLQSPEFGEALNGLANYFVACSEYDKATLVFDRALNVFFKNRLENHPVYIDILNSSGSMYYGLQVFPEAHRLYELAIGSIETHGMYDDYNTPILYHNSGLVSCHLQRMGEARVRLVRSVITALQNGQEWVLWKSCYSLSYLLFQEQSLDGAMFFGKLALAITIQSWQDDAAKQKKALDPFLAEHMEHLFAEAGRVEEWVEIQGVVDRYCNQDTPTDLEDSLQFFDAQQRVHFQVFLMLSLQVKQIPLTAMNAAMSDGAVANRGHDDKIAELERGFMRLLARWHKKKPGRLAL